MSEVLRKYSKDLVKVLALSSPSNTILTTGLYSKSVIDEFEKLEITSESNPFKSATLLVNYIISRASQYKAEIWNELDSIEALKDVMENIKKEGG